MQGNFYPNLPGSKKGELLSKSRKRRQPNRNSPFLKITRADGTVEHTTVVNHLIDVGFFERPEEKPKKPRKRKNPNRSALPAQLRRRIFKRDKGHCRYCYQDMTGMEWHIDHVIPRVDGGTDVEANLVLSCPRCNQEKYVRTAKPLPIWDGTYNPLAP